MPCVHTAGISGASYYEGYFSNVSRNSSGTYVAVSSRGNFYMWVQLACLCAAFVHFISI